MAAVDDTIGSTFVAAVDDAIGSTLVAALVDTSGSTHGAAAVDTAGFTFDHLFPYDRSAPFSITRPDRGESELRRSSW